MRLILDMGSGASLPDQATARKMIQEVAKRDTHKHEIVFKTQLFTSAPPNTPLLRSVFSAAYEEAKKLGYKCTSSVFDRESLDYLLGYDIPFVKIACRPDLYWLASEVPRKMPVYMSVGPNYRPTDCGVKYVDVWMGCISKYPAKEEDYRWFAWPDPRCVSDHTVGWGMLNGTPDAAIWEKHLKLPETTGPDAGPWAVMPAELEGII